jgi:hypothetical protein
MGVTLVCFPQPFFGIKVVIHQLALSMAGREFIGVLVL